jgi:hypothetical protein
MPTTTVVSAVSCFSPTLKDIRECNGTGYIPAGVYQDCAIASMNDLANDFTYPNPNENSSYKEYVIVTGTQTFKAGKGWAKAQFMPDTVSLETTSAGSRGALHAVTKLKGTLQVSQDSLGFIEAVKNMSLVVAIKLLNGQTLMLGRKGWGASIVSYKQLTNSEVSHLEVEFEVKNAMPVFLPGDIVFLSDSLPVVP